MGNYYGLLDQVGHLTNLCVKQLSLLDSSLKKMNEITPLYKRTPIHSSHSFSWNIATRCERTPEIWSQSWSSSNFVWLRFECVMLELLSWLFHCCSPSISYITLQLWLGLLLAFLTALFQGISLSGTVGENEAAARQGREVTCFNWVCNCCLALVDTTEY